MSKTLELSAYISRYLSIFIWICLWLWVCNIYVYLLEFIYYFKSEVLQCSMAFMQIADSSVDIVVIFLLWRFCLFVCFLFILFCVYLLLNLLHLYIFLLLFLDCCSIYMCCCCCWGWCCWCYCKPGYKNIVRWFCNLFGLSHKTVHGQLANCPRTKLLLLLYLYLYL